METIKYNSINHGLICSWNKFKLLTNEEIWNIYSNILSRYKLNHVKKSKKSEVIGVKHSFFYILCMNKHKVIHVGQAFHVDHSTVINGRDKVRGFLMHKEEKAKYWYNVVIEELKKHGYKDYSNFEDAN